MAPRRAEIARSRVNPGVAGYVGGRVRTLRLRRRLTQQQLADAVSVHRVTVAHIEGGRLRPSLPLVLDLARALGVGPGGLLPKGGWRHA